MSTSVSTAVRRCEFCGGAGRLAAYVPGTTHQTGLVWCRCPRGRRAELVLRSLSLWIEARNCSPTIRELAGACGLTLSAAYRAVCDLADAGLVLKPTATASRTLRLIQGGQ